MGGIDDGFSLKLDNPIIVDRNGLQMEGDRNDKGLEPLKEKFEAFGLFCLETCGHDFPSICKTFAKAAQEKGFPKAIIAHTKWGRGITLAENGEMPVKASLSRNQVTLLLDELSKESAALSEEER